MRDYHRRWGRGIPLLFAQICFAYVKDVFDRIIILANDCISSGKLYESDLTEQIPVEELASILKNMNNSSSELHYILCENAYSEDFYEILLRVPSIDKVKKQIDYKPETSLQDSEDL